MFRNPAAPTSRRWLALGATVCLALPALAQTDADTESDRPLDCAGTDGGIACKVEMAEGETLYCLAYGPDDEPRANSTVSSDDGLAVFNGLVVEDVSAIRCRTP